MKLLDVLVKKSPLSPPPMWMMRQAGRYLPEYRAIRQNHNDFMKFCFTPKDVVTVTLQPVERFPLDAAIIFSDILVIPHVLGQKVWFEANHGPRLEAVDFEGFIEKAHDVSFVDALTPVTDAILETRLALDSSKALIGFAGGPWTILTYMISRGKTVDFNDVLNFVDKNPGLFASLLDLVTEKVAELLCLHLKAGANVVQIFESWAAAVPSALRQAYLYQPLDRIVKAVRSKIPNAPIIYYGRGVSGDYGQLTHLDIAFGVDETANFQTVGDQLPNAVLQGNFPPALLLNGTHDEIKRTADGISQSMAGRPFVFNLGHGIDKDTPITNVECLLSHIQKGHF